MKVNFGHTATTSFSLWFEHHLIQHGEAYQNTTGKFYFVEDERLPEGFYRYSSPHKQWVTEKDAGGAHVPDLISGNNSQILRSEKTRGYYFDFLNGGVVVTGDAANPNLTLSGSYAVKDFNIYNTNETEESLIVENKFENNSRFGIVESGIAPYDFVTPAVFINNEYTENKPFAFGGEDQTVMSFKSVVFAENLYQLDGILSLFADTHKISFPKIEFKDHPINEYGDLKNSYYKYDELPIDSKAPIFNIDRVVTSKISENIRQSVSPTLFIGFIDFEVSQPRFPRLY